MPKFKPRGRPAADRPDSASRLVAFFDHEWLHRWAYVLLAVSGIVLGLCLTVLEEVLPAPLLGIVEAVAAAFLGVAMIGLSRALASARDSAPWILRIFNEGIWWGRVDFGPWVFRMWGSGGIGYGAGRLIHVVVGALGAEDGAAVAGFVVGGVVGLGAWIWTWVAFPEIED